MRFKGKTVLLLGSGGLRIGQAGEFDYSGSQAIKALKEEGIRVILVNPNIATVQTDEHMADKLYLQPLNVECVTKIIEREKPDAILLGFGGQTALNLGLELENQGILDKHHVEVLGTQVASIMDTEDRDLFKKALEGIGVKCPKSFSAKTVEEAIDAAAVIGYPVMLRAGFSLGGLGSGKIKDEKELKKRAKECFSKVPQILIEEYLLGWKEFEYEIVRDVEGNSLTICNMENMDPMGVHTGESIVIAPAQTLTNAEHQQLRNMSIAIARLFKIVGECNIQFSVNPEDGDYRVIEMNARLSRSSALASKATGYPLAHVATKLALGYLLHDITNTVTGKTCAFFEPALDYVVVKIPRWDTHKLKVAERTIGTEMKSVGEVMGIGRSFPEALQKAVGMLNIGATCLSDYPQAIDDPMNEIEFPTDRRLFAIYKFFKNGGTVEDVHQCSKINTWFLQHIHACAQLDNHIKTSELTKDLLRQAKRMGFSDRAIGKLVNTTEDAVRQLRIEANIIPFVKQIDTLAGEFEAQTNYLYLTYHGTEHDIAPSTQRPIIVLGSGPYAIGSSVEFDWCAVNTSRTLRQAGRKSILINSNPETVSTDYDESDRLYFDQLTLERVRDIADFENPEGIVVSVGGQIANTLALPLAKRGYSLLGTKAESIDQAENREKFSALLNELGVDQPEWIRASSIDNAKKFAREIGYPVLIRPSYILSGSAMNVAHDEWSLEKYLKEASLVSSDHPVVMSKFIQDAKELEVDGVANQGDVIIDCIAEHVENAGIHSGDATIVIPPQRLYLETIRKTKKITKEIVAALNITGPFNIQFIARNNCIQVIECNLRAARSFPFVSKVTGYNFIELATYAILGKHKPINFETLELDYVAVKVPQFSYNRLKGSDPVASVEMASTGEVACIGEDLYDAYLRAWLSSDQSLPAKKRMLVSIADKHKEKLLPLLKQLDDQGWSFYCTEGTHRFLTENGIGSYFVCKVKERAEPNLATLVAQRKVDLILNIPTSDTINIQSDGYMIRRLAVDHHIPLITNMQLSQVILQCFINYKSQQPETVLSWQEFIERHEKRSPKLRAIA